MANDVTKKDEAAVTMPATSVLGDSAQVLALIERMATNPSVDVAKLNAMLDVQERIMNKNAEMEANEAFARVVAAMPIIRKNGMIDFNKPGVKPIPYAKWEDVQRIIRPIYESEGFTLSFDGRPLEGGWSEWTAICMHRNGHTRKSSVPLPLDNSGGKQNIQGMGSTASYAQRYTTKNLFNLVFEGEDDDGVAAGVVFISAEQVKKINDLLTETKSDKTAFLKHFDVTEVVNIQVKDYARVLNALEKKKAKIAADAKGGTNA